MKKFLMVLVVLVVLVAVALAVTASQAGNIIHRAVETFGPDITGTPVTLSDVDVSLLTGQASINNLVIGNPQGFKSEHALQVGEVDIKLDIASLFSNRVRITRILIDGAELT